MRRVARACNPPKIRLKIRRSQGRGGSPPPPATTDKILKLNRLRKNTASRPERPFRVWKALVPVLVPVCSSFAIVDFRGSIPCRERLRRRNEEFLKRSPVLTSGGFVTTST